MLVPLYPTHTLLPRSRSSLIPLVGSPFGSVTVYAFTPYTLPYRFGYVPLVDYLYHHVLPYVLWFVWFILPFTTLVSWLLRLRSYVCLRSFGWFGYFILPLRLLVTLRYVYTFTLVRWLVPPRFTFAPVRCSRFILLLRLVDLLPVLFTATHYVPSLVDYSLRSLVRLILVRCCSFMRSRFWLLRSVRWFTLRYFGIAVRLLLPFGL